MKVTIRNPRKDWKGREVMINYDRYKNVITKMLFEFKCDEKNRRCEICRFKIMCRAKQNRSLDSFRLWLNEEPIKLTQAEKCILENINKKYRYVFRNGRNNIFFTENKIIKEVKNDVWIAADGDHILASMFDHLFQFIKWDDEEPYNIKELLENCEVEE